MPLVITWTFAPGQIIFASRFNTNFTDVKTWADTHEVTTHGIHGVVGDIVGTTDLQNLSNKTILDNVKWKSGTAFDGILDHSNTVNRTYTYPDASGNVPSLPTPATTETGSGAIVRANGPTINNLTVTGTFVFPSGAAGTVPIGTIVPFQDFGGLVTFDTAIWKYCDGTAIPGAPSPTNPLGGQFTEDMSGRYLIGFGTVGGGNIGTDPWATPAVGNAGWTTNIQHSHTVNNHTHDLSNHAHNAGTYVAASHTHGTSDLVAAIMVRPSDSYYTGVGPIIDGIFADMRSIVDAAYYWGPFNAVDGGPFNCDNAGGFSANADGHQYTGGTAILGDTDFSGPLTVAGASSGPSTNTSGGATPGTDNQLSTVQDIRPSSIRVRYIIRYT